MKCRFPLKAEQPACFTSCGATIQLDNALDYGCDVFFQGDYGILRARHLTVNQCNTLGLDDGYDSSLHLTNSLLVAVTNWGDIPYSTATNKVVYYATNPGGIFQTVGRGRTIWRTTERSELHSCKHCLMQVVHPEGLEPPTF